MSDNLAPQDVLIIRLADGDTPAKFQNLIEAQAGPVTGELLSWLDGPWCYLSGGYEALLAQRLAGTTVDALCGTAGAAAVARVPFAELQTRLERRARRTDFLRDAGASGVAPPGVVGDTIAVDGRQVQLDWQITVTGINAAWGLFDLTPGKLPWADIRVGHIDTGCTRHPGLGFKGDASDYVRADHGRNLFSDFLPLPDPGMATNDPPEETGPFDNLGGANGGHGTRTLSVLAGFYELADDSQPPFHGAAPGACVIPYRVTNSVLIDHVQRLMAEAIDDAIGKQCRVITMSLGGIVPYGRLAKAIDRAHEAGVIVCAAAGNVIREVTYPGRYNRVVTVGGVSPVGTTGFQAWDGASRGQFVDICGPADGVRRASVLRRKSELNYFIAADGDGTSYATALCAGIAVLWLAKRQADLKAAYGDPNWCWPAAFKRLLKETAECPAGWDTANWGRGSIGQTSCCRPACPRQMHCITKTRPRRRSIRWLDIFGDDAHRRRRNAIQAIRDTFGDILACLADDGGIDPKWESDAE